MVEEGVGEGEGGGGRGVMAMVRVGVVVFWVGGVLVGGMVIGVVCIIGILNLLV